MVVSVSQTEQQWIRTTDRQSGRPLYVAVPSKSQPNKFHLVSSQGCDCRGYSFRQTCSHFRPIIKANPTAARPSAVTSRWSV